MQWVEMGYNLHVGIGQLWQSNKTIIIIIYYTLGSIDPEG